VALTYPLVNDDCPKPRFSRNRGSLRIANALNSNSTDWQNVQSVIGGGGGGGGGGGPRQPGGRPTVPSERGERLLMMNRLDFPNATVCLCANFVARALDPEE
jgi:hypothetical protein